MANNKQEKLVLYQRIFHSVTRFENKLLVLSSLDELGILYESRSLLQRVRSEIHFKSIVQPLYVCLTICIVVTAKRVD